VAVVKRERVNQKYFTDRLFSYFWLTAKVQGDMDRFNDFLKFKKEQEKDK